LMSLQLFRHQKFSYKEEARSDYRPSNSLNT
jgi:hypothetical protein